MYKVPCWVLKHLYLYKASFLFILLLFIHRLRKNFYVQIIFPFEMVYYKVNKHDFYTCRGRYLKTWMIPAVVSD